MRYRSATEPRRAWILWLCAFALLGFQLVGHWHRIAHAPGSAPTEATQKSSVWGHTSGDSDCRLFDQLSHDPGFTLSEMPVCAAPQMVLADAPLRAGTHSAARWKRGARGPPDLSA